MIGCDKTHLVVQVRVRDPYYCLKRLKYKNVDEEFKQAYRLILFGPRWTFDFVVDFLKPLDSFT